MLYYALVFLAFAVVAGIFAITGVAAGTAGIAKVLCVVFLICCAVSAAFGWERRRRGE